MREKFNKAVIWDMDGVIADTGPFHFAAWRDLGRGRGRDFNEQDFQYSFGRRNDDILKYLFSTLASEEIETLSKEKEDLFRSKIKGRISLLPGVLKLLEIQRKGNWGIALASSAPPKNIDLTLSSLGIAGYFGSIISGEDVRKGKPDPEVFLLAAERLNVPPDRCIVIEDATAGVEAAKAGGMKCIAVTNSHPPEALAKADLVTDNLEKIGGEDLKRLLATY